jgi:hypothetical protein
MFLAGVFLEWLIKAVKTQQLLTFHSEGYFPLRKIIRGLERTRKFFFVLKSLVPTQSSQDKENLSCPFNSNPRIIFLSGN